VSGSLGILDERGVRVRLGLGFAGAVSASGLLTTFTVPLVTDPPLGTEALE